MTKSLDNQTAVFFGTFVNAAYRMYEADPSNLTPPPAGITEGWSLVAWIQMSDFALGDSTQKFYGFIAQNNVQTRSFVVAIRGTEGTTEWWDDAHIASVPFTQVPNAGRVAQGFDRIYGTLGVRMRKPASAEGVGVEAQPLPLKGTFAEQVAQAVTAGSGAQKLDLNALDFTMPVVAVTGHSLGAALCTLYVMENAAKKVINNPTVCTFASPRVGNSAFVQAFNALQLASWRIVNAADLVPNLPPDIFGYAHVDTQCLFDSTGKVRSTISCAHSLDTYLCLLDPSRKPTTDCTPSSADVAMSEHLGIASAESVVQPSTASSSERHRGVSLKAPASVTININIFSEPPSDQ